jgi:Type IV pilus assembly protein PilM
LKINDPGADTDTGRVPAILDLGHARTNLFVGKDGQGIFARAITRGGQHLTAAIAEALGVDRGRAEQVKRGEARLVFAGGVAATDAEVRIDQALRTALGPLMREVRQTLAGFRASTDVEIATLYITGGGARLRGMIPFLEDELGLSVAFLPVPNTLQGSAAMASPLRPVDDEDATDDTAVDQISLQETTRFVRQASESSAFALATAIVVAASSGTREIDLRRGPFLYRARRPRTWVCWGDLFFLPPVCICSRRCRIWAPNARRWTPA